MGLSLFSSQLHMSTSRLLNLVEQVHRIAFIAAQHVAYCGALDLGLLNQWPLIKYGFFFPHDVYRDDTSHNPLRSTLNKLDQMVVDKVVILLSSW